MFSVVTISHDALDLTTSHQMSATLGGGPFTHNELDLLLHGPLGPCTVDKRAVRILLASFLVVNHSVLVIIRETDGDCSV